MAAAGGEAEVVLVVPTGSEAHVLMRLDGQNLTGLFRERLRSARGERMRLVIDDLRQGGPSKDDERHDCR